MSNTGNVGNARAEREHRESVVTSSTRHVSPGDLAEFLPYACLQLQVAFNVRVHVTDLQEYVSPVTKPRSKMQRGSTHAAAPPPATPADLPDADSDGELLSPPDRYLDHVPVTMTLDAAGRVVQVELTRVSVPRELLQVLALAAPYNPSLARLELRQCRLRGDILHELAKPAFAALTDICLDGSPVPEANYATLLDGDRVRRLSLARLWLDDGVCAELASRLRHARSLRLLDLGSNAVGNAGAVALAHALRTNRTLLHLNLIGNRIGDNGASELLRTLTPFPLTSYEVLESRRRRFAHLRSVHATTAALRKEAPTSRIDDAKRGRRGIAMPMTGRGGAAPRRGSRAASMPDDAEERAAMRANMLVGSYNDPFAPSETVCVSGHMYCAGNRVLCYLNLAHNHLTVLTAARLANTLEAQRVTRRTSLLRVVLEGNPLPSADEHQKMSLVEELLERAIAAAARAEHLHRRSIRPRTGR